MRRYRTKSAFTSFLRALRDKTIEPFDAPELSDEDTTAARAISGDAAIPIAGAKGMGGRKEAPDA